VKTFGTSMMNILQRIDEIWDATSTNQQKQQQTRAMNYDVTFIRNTCVDSLATIWTSNRQWYATHHLNFLH